MALRNEHIESAAREIEQSAANIVIAELWQRRNFDGWAFHNVVVT